MGPNMTSPVNSSGRMGPEVPLPLPKTFTDVEGYVQSLLQFSTSSELLQTLCGGVHILDFFTRTPDLYTQILPESWRDWFKSLEIRDILDLLMREDLEQFASSHNGEQSADENHVTPKKWRNAPAPPVTLISYIEEVRSHLLSRDFHHIAQQSSQKLNRYTSVGMNVKKAHEVSNFARYVDHLTAKLSTKQDRQISHLIDFGAGQNYLGRALASNPYNRDIIAIESRNHVVEGARKMDIAAKLVERELVKVNKKEYRAAKVGNADQKSHSVDGLPVSLDKTMESKTSEKKPFNTSKAEDIPKFLPNGYGTVQYVEHRIQDGDLHKVIHKISHTAETEQNKPVYPGQMVISLHSCGNLLHHGLRTITLNPSVQAIALVGCCYNLMTERLGPPTYKLPALRQHHPRLEATGNTCDPHGFPMSTRFLKYRTLVTGISGSQNTNNDPLDGGYRDSIDKGETSGHDSVNYEEGIRLNITARMMAVQAPQNWCEQDSASFFTRHFYRALLQRIFLDKGIFKHLLPPILPDSYSLPSSASANTKNTAPIIIGTLSKKCYISFPDYVRGAVAKIVGSGAEIAGLVGEKVGAMDDKEILEYERIYGERKKELSVVWSLMAFSAGIVEAMIVVDRWVWLTEQDCVGEAWVEPVFEYGKSPRNLVVVGVKK